MENEEATKYRGASFLTVSVRVPSHHIAQELYEGQVKALQIADKKMIVIGDYIIDACRTSSLSEGRNIESPHQAHEMPGEKDLWDVGGLCGHLPGRKVKARPGQCRRGLG